MAGSLNPWPSARDTLLPQHVDRIAAEHPDTIYAEYPRSPTTFADGFIQVTYGELSNAVNGLAWWLEKTLGRGEDFPTLVYFGHNDLRYIILILGAAKAGYKMLFPTPRYSADALTALIGQLNAKVLLQPAGPLPIVNAILSKRAMDLYQIPNLDDLLGKQYSHYPYTKTFEQARSDPLVVVHTSGTTGAPKPIIWTNEWADSFGAERYLEPPSGFASMDGYLLGTRIFSLMPPFHAAHLYGSIFFSLYRGSVMIYPLPSLPPSAAMAAEALQYTNADILAVPPLFLEQIGNDPEILEAISEKVPVICWAGGDVSEAVGEAVTTKVKLFTSCGSSEAGLWPLLRPEHGWNPENWHYMRLHPAMNMFFDPIIEQQGVYEGVIRRNDETAGNYIQPIFRLFPELQEYRTRDLFIQNPSNSELWRHYGRSDDLQVLASGEKYHPAEFEKRITEHPHVHEALIVGTRLTRNTLLLRLKKEHYEQGIDPIWDIIEQSNKMCTATTQIKKEFIYLVDPERPFPRTAKGTVRRNATAELYQKELTGLFE